MLRRVLILAAALVVAPVSYTVLLVWMLAPALDFALFFLETMARAQVWALLVLSPIIVATKAWEYAKRFI